MSKDYSFSLSTNLPPRIRNKLSFANFFPRVQVVSHREISEVFDTIKKNVTK